jgi:ankyrin repeat protein
MDLLAAVRRNDIDSVNRLLLNPNVDVNVTDRNGNTALIEAARDNNVQIGQRLIEAGADINLANIIGLRPLHAAVESGHKEFVVLLLEQDGLNLDALTNNGSTALTIAMSRLQPEIPEMLLESGANPNIATPGGTTPLHMAVSAGNLHFVQLLVEKGADVNRKDMAGQTALMEAIWPAYLDISAYLLSIQGIDIDAQDKNGMTALMFAAQHTAHGKQLITELLSAGADPLLTSKVNKTAQQYVRNQLQAPARILARAESTWRASEVKSLRDISGKFMIAHRLRTNHTLPQKQLGDYIIRRSEYDNLCVGLQSNLNKPGVIALAKSLKIKTVGQNKMQLCNEISKRLTIK